MTTIAARRRPRVRAEIAGHDADRSVRRERARTGLLHASVTVYVVLWILEGLGRKWVPGSQNLLYVGRDGLILLSIGLLALVWGRPARRAVWFWAYCGVLVAWTVVQLLLSDLRLVVAVVGLRTYIAPVLLVLLVDKYRRPQLFDWIAKPILWATPLELVLTVLQVLSSPTSPINREVGSDDPAALVNSGVVRASGTFTAPAGLANFLPLALAVGLVYLGRASRGDRRLGVMAVASTCVMIALGGNRLAVLGAIFVVAVYLIVQLVALRLRPVLQAIGFVVGAGALFGIALLAAPGVLGSFFQRFQDASQSEDVGGRVLDEMFGFLAQPLTILGDGIGAHSQAGINVGSPLQWVEWDTEKWVWELGTLGFAMAVVRLGLAIALVWMCVRRLRSAPDVAQLGAALIPLVLYSEVTQQPSLQGLLSVALSLFVLAVRSPQELRRAPGDVSARHGSAPSRR